jgi:hypothetical protein
MGDTHEPGWEGRGPTSAQLRHAIDSGKTGDKVGGFDPAAAPMDADSEAGGAPLTPDLVALDLATEKTGAPDSARANAATPELPPDGRLPPQKGLLLVGVGGAAVAVALAALLFAAL